MDIKSITHILICFALGLCELHLIKAEISDYITIILTYYRARNVSILTHFTCFSLGDNSKIYIALSVTNIQSRFIGVSELAPQLDTPTPTVQGFIVNKKCNHSQKIFHSVDHGVIFKNNNLWLFIDNNEANLNIGESMVEYKSELNELNALPTSDLFIARHYQNDTIHWNLFDAYKLNYGYDIEITENGVIEAAANANDLMVVSGADFSSARRRNLNGVNITCGLVIEHPEQLTNFDDPSEDHVDVFTKGSINVGTNLRENLNFSCLMRQATREGWLESETLSNGLSSLFQTKQIQMTIHGVIMKPEQLSYAEFAGDIITPRTPLIFRQPALSAVANIFVLPLGLDVWICIFILMFVVFIIMMLQLMHPILKTMSITAFDVATFIFGAVCQQGTHLHIPTTSGRLVVLTTFLATLALFTSYSASIVALLQSPSDFINSLDDMIASPLKVGMYEADYARYLVDAKYSGLIEVYDKKVLPQGEKGWIDDAFIAVERVRTELFAFQVDSPTGYRVIGRIFDESEKCSLSELQMIVLPTSTILTERNSGYKELIRQRINWLREIGLMKRDELRWTPSKPVCEGGLSGFVSVSLDEIKPAVILVLFGYGLSILILGFEVLSRNMRCKYQKKTNVRYFY